MEVTVRPAVWMLADVVPVVRRDHGGVVEVAGVIAGISFGGMLVLGRNSLGWSATSPGIMFRLLLARVWVCGGRRFQDVNSWALGYVSSYSCLTGARLSRLLRLLLPAPAGRMGLPIGIRYRVLGCFLACRASPVCLMPGSRAYWQTSQLLWCKYECLGQSQCHIGELGLGGLGLLKTQPPSPADPSRDPVDTYVVGVYEVVWEAPNANLVVAAWVVACSSGSQVYDQSF